MLPAELFRKSTGIQTAFHDLPADGFMEIRKDRGAGILLPRQLFLALVCPADIQFHSSFPPITITAESTSSVTCRNQPARSPVTPPNCL